MLFSSPDYPLFLIAVFFLYALVAVERAAVGARVALMVVARRPRVRAGREGSRRAVGSARRHAPARCRGGLRRAVRPAARRLAVASGRSGSPCSAARCGSAGARRVDRVGARAALDRARARRGARRSSARRSRSARARARSTAMTAQIARYGAPARAARARRRARRRRARTQTRALGRVIVLFVASSLFYQAWAAAMPGPYRYLLALLLGTIVLDYYLGALDRAHRGPVRGARRS